MRPSGRDLPAFCTGRRAWLRGTVVGAVVGVLFVGASYSGLLDSVSFGWLDTLLYLRGSRPPTDIVRVVAADAPDFRKLKPPFEVPPTLMPRRPLAQAVRRLADAGARVVVLDVVLDTPSPEPGDDAELASALTYARARNVGLVGAANLVQAEDRQVVLDARPDLGLRGETALANVAASRDGVVRFVDLATTVDGRLWLSVAARAARLYDRERFRAVVRGWRRQVLINYYGPAGTFTMLPFADLVNGLLPADWLRGRIVIIGRTDPVASDSHWVPMLPGLPGRRDTAAGRARMSGLEVQANAVATILLARFLTRTTLLGDVLVQVIVAAIAAWFAMRWGAAGVLGLLAVGTALAAGAGVWLLRDANYWLNIVPVSLALVAHVVLAEANDRRRLRALFGPYVGPAMMRKLWSQRQDLVLGGEERVVSLLVYDIHDSTTAAERIAPGEVAALLNKLFSLVAPVIWQRGGAVNKYLGDGLLATFNAPLDQPNHADAAIEAAMGAVRAADRLKAEWKAVSGHNLVAYAAVHTGTVLAGNIGSPERMEYTVVGDSVNVAFRMMSSCKDHGALIQVSEASWEASQLALTGARFEMEVRGRSEKLALYALQSFQIVETPRGGEGEAP